MHLTAPCTYEPRTGEAAGWVKQPAAIYSRATKRASHISQGEQSSRKKRVSGEPTVRHSLSLEDLFGQLLDDDGGRHTEEAILLLDVIEDMTMPYPRTRI